MCWLLPWIVQKSPKLNRDSIRRASQTRPNKIHEQQKKKYIRFSTFTVCPTELFLYHWWFFFLGFVRVLVKHIIIKLPLIIYIFFLKNFQKENNFFFRSHKKHTSFIKRNDFIWFINCISNCTHFFFFFKKSIGGLVLWQTNFKLNRIDEK